MTRRVYFIKPIGMDGPIKIGVSYAPDRRRETLEFWSPFRLEIVAEYEGGGVVERQFHAMFAADHVHHEWFNATPRLASVIAAINDGTFDGSSLPDPAQLPRKKRDNSYVTPEWRAARSAAAKRDAANRREWREERQRKAAAKAARKPTRKSQAVTQQ